MVTWATDINNDPSCIRTMDPDMAIRSSLGLVVTMTADGSTDLSVEWAKH